MPAAALAVGGSGPSMGDDPAAHEYASMGLELLGEFLRARPQAELLDIGPTCGRNISYFAQRVKRLHVCDMFVRLRQDLDRGWPAGRALRHLDHPKASFDAILLWDYLDRLEDSFTSRLAQLCLQLVKPGGLVCLTAEPETIGPQVRVFEMGEVFMVRPRTRRGLTLPRHWRQNRQVLAAMDRFYPLKSFVYRNGVREFVFRRD